MSLHNVSKCMKVTMKMTSKAEEDIGIPVHLLQSLDRQI